MRAVVRWGIVGVKSERGEGTRWGTGKRGEGKAGADRGAEPARDGHGGRCKSVLIDEMAWELSLTRTRRGTALRKEPLFGAPILACCLVAPGATEEARSGLR